MEEDMKVIASAITEAEKYGLTVEVIYFSLLGLKADPTMTIQQAIAHGLEEWIK